jgi:hypothetical protein
MRPRSVCSSIPYLAIRVLAPVMFHVKQSAGLILFVNEVEIEEDAIRIISVRTANKKELEAYYGNCALYFGNRT